MRRLAFLLASAAAVLLGSISPALASTHDNAGQESQDAAAATDWFTLQRLAPNGAVDPSAFAAVAGQAASLPVVGRAWSERTNLPGAQGNDFSHSPQYIYPTRRFSHS